MVVTYSATEARRCVPRLLRMAEEGHRVHITYYGKVVAVLARPAEAEVQHRAEATRNSTPK